jgi:cell division protein FtsW (lipid II flippase)
VNERYSLSNNDHRHQLPIRTLHDFLFEISEEWGRFRRGSLLTMIVTMLLFLLFIPRYFVLTLISRDRFDTVIAVAIIIALLYSVYLAFCQYRFYQRWERRIGLLLHLEAQLLDEKS